MAILGRVGLVGALLLAGISLSACGSGAAVSEARASCGFVHRALRLESDSTARGVSATRRAQLQAAAMSELIKGTSSAAAATSSDGSWNALMTTIAEAQRVPLRNLIPALQRLCQVADSSSPYL